MKLIQSLYIHFPFCAHLCNYCDFFKSVSKTESEVSDFENYFEKSFEAHQKLLEEYNFSFGDLNTIYIGGGTPSLWGERGAEFLNNFLNKNQLKLSENCEFTMEVNPGQYRPSEIDLWESIGVNRFSVGLQSLNPKFIRYLDRVHNLNDSIEALEYFSQKDNVSFDLMLGLPFSEIDSRDVYQELDTILKYSPQHLSLYILTVKGNYVHKEHLPSEEFVQSEYLGISKMLVDRGFEHYEVSNFCTPNKHSVHNLKYWALESVAAIGPSATGFLNDQNNHIRYKWDGYKLEPSTEVLNQSEYKLEKIYLSLRSNIGLPLSLSYIDDIEQIKWKKLAEKWVDQEKAIIKNNLIKLTSKGLILLDSLMNDIFVNLKTL